MKIQQQHPQDAQLLECKKMDITNPAPNSKMKNNPIVANSSVSKRQSKMSNVQNFILLERFKFTIHYQEVHHHEL